MGEVIQLPLAAPTPALMRPISAWEDILGDQPPRGQKNALVTAYSGGLMPASTVSYFFERWNLGSV